MKFVLNKHISDVSWYPQGYIFSRETLAKHYIITCIVTLKAMTLKIKGRTEKFNTKTLYTGWLKSDFLF